MNKLITHEDPIHFHKLFGAISLLNYGLQYYLYFTNKRPIFNIYTILPHMILHLSSFIFKVLSKRPVENKMSMFIWEELRIHSLIFAWRACFVILFMKYAKIITFVSMILADLVSYKYGTNGISTVRGQHDKVGKRNLIKELLGAFFSISQFGGTIITSGVIQTFPSKILVFSTLPPIQTSSFGMTLIRKNIINYKIWTIIYSIELLITYCIWYMEYKNLNIFFLSLFLYFLRRIGISKYIIWLFVFLLDYKVDKILLQYT
jgi:hypothetical protein